MNRLVLAILLLAGATMSVAIQQNGATNAAGSGSRSNSTDRPGQLNLVFDDDGGTVQVVPPDLAVTLEKKFHGGEVMKSAQQVSIFLGPAWGDLAVRSRQATLADLGSQQNASLAELQSKNVRGLSAAPGVEDFSDLSRAQVNDIAIQRKLDDLLAKNAIPSPDASTIYVIYLAPGIHSSLGANKAGADYAAYHNFVHLAAVEIRYVVVPFHDSVDHQAAAAARAFAEAALNPNGNGWY
jgi:hypothetical protein